MTRQSIALLFFVFVDFGDEVHKPFFIAVNHQHLCWRIDFKIPVIAQRGKNVDHDNLQNHDSHKREQIVPEIDVGEVDAHDAEFKIRNDVGDKGGKENRINDFLGFFDAEGKSAVYLYEAESRDNKGGHRDTGCPGKPEQLRLNKAEQSKKYDKQNDEQQRLKSQQEGAFQFFDKMLYHKNGPPCFQKPRKNNL